MPAIDNRMGVAAAAMFGAAWRALITAHEERDSGERTMGGGLTWSKPGAKFVVSGSPSAATDRSIAGHIAMTHAYSLPQRSWSIDYLRPNSRKGGAPGRGLEPCLPTAWQTAYSVSAMRRPALGSCADAEGTAAIAATETMMTPIRRLTAQLLVVLSQIDTNSHAHMPTVATFVRYSMDLKTTYGRTK